MREAVSKSEVTRRGAERGECPTGEAPLPLGCLLLGARSPPGPEHGDEHGDDEHGDGAPIPRAPIPKPDPVPDQEHGDGAFARRDSDPSPNPVPSEPKPDPQDGDGAQDGDGVLIPTLLISPHEFQFPSFQSFVIPGRR